MVLIKSAIKNEGKVNDKVELITYEVETPALEVQAEVEETVEESSQDEVKTEE